MDEIKIKCDVGNVSDGYHTFNELYAHRNFLFIALMKSNIEFSWISLKHDDGSMYDGYFIAGMRLPKGNVSYHLPAHMWGTARDAGIKFIDKSPAWDGYTPDDVLARVINYIKS